MGGSESDGDYSVIGDKGEIGFIDFKDDNSVCSNNPKNQGPIIVSSPFPIIGGKPQSVPVGKIAVESITIHNTTDETVDLWTVKIYAATPENTFTLSLLKPPTSEGEVVPGFLESFCMEDRHVQPGRTLTIWLSCKPKEIGLHTTVVQFDVGNERIERVVFLLADDKISNSLASNKPYSRSARKNNSTSDSFSMDKYVSGKRPVRQHYRESRYKLPLYSIPKDVRQSMAENQIPEAVMVGLRQNNYAAYFKNMVIMEELHLEDDIKIYDMPCVCMKRAGIRFVTLEVPGLAERRPSLVNGDFVLAKLVGKDSYDNSPPFQGFIHRVEADQVFLRFADGFHSNHRDGYQYEVHFTYNRLNMRRLYQAIEAAECLETKFLFPSESHGKRRIRETPIVPISCDLNEEQMRCIEMILGCKGAPPYIIHGPPGTGKTMTIVETVLQLYTTRKNPRILVCAPSNNAADHILDKILHEKEVQIAENSLLRLNATSRSYDEVNENHIPFCYSEDLTFKCPPVQALKSCRIIISTYMSASLLYSEGLKRGHFSHIILDEAGHASEPETMIPISHLCKENTVVVLAGDPMQLGPVVFSKDAEYYGLGKSYLERLFESDLYVNGDENYVKKLVRNYRCHPEILRLPSELFYNSELIACKDDKSVSATWMDLLPNREFPILFVGVQGCDEREGNNPSWFNRIEASKVAEIIKKLIPSENLNEDDIGVITPYRQQVVKIKMALESLDMLNVKVGSVEQFQGQERQVIIISTVRSTIKHNEFDITHCLGFLTNPRRFNVAVTRARSMLIIVGNPHIVGEDIYWHRLLWHCQNNGSYQGCALPEPKKFPENEPTHDDGFTNEEGNYHTNWGEDSFEQSPCPAQWTDDCIGSSVKEELQPKHATNECEWSDGWNTDFVQQDIASNNCDSRDENYHLNVQNSNWVPSNESGWSDCWWNNDGWTNDVVNEEEKDYDSGVISRNQPCEDFDFGKCSIQDNVLGNVESK